MKPYDYKKDPYWPSFDGVRGYTVEVDRLKSMASALRNNSDPRLFPKGILFSGTPGTGKTTLAKAFIAMTGFSCFIPGACPDSRSLSKIYDQASRKTPSIVFLDDVDRIVSVLGSEGFISDESQACLKEILARLDGVEDSKGVITVMTTNEYCNLDEAMKRSGRVDLHIPINKPNDADRLAILEYYMEKYPGLYPESSLALAEGIASKCQNMSCADLALIVKDVYLSNYGKTGPVSTSDLADDFQGRIMEINSGGLLKKVCKNENDIKRICYHESGHALLDWILCGKASDICCLQTADEDFGGWTAPRSTDKESRFLDLTSCMNEIAVCLGGMVAEEKVMGNISVGCNSDIKAAHGLSKLILASCLEADFSYLPAVLPEISLYTDDDNQTEEYIDRVQKKEQSYLAQGYVDATFWIDRHRESLDRLAQALIERGILSAEKVTEILVEDKVPRNFRKELEEKL